MNFTTSK